ncbi:hypothetical protein MRX96_010459 [Rhipicephalus microplus]
MDTPTMSLLYPRDDTGPGKNASTAGKEKIGLGSSGAFTYEAEFPNIVPLTSFGRNTRDSTPCGTTAGPVLDEQQHKGSGVALPLCPRASPIKERRLASLFPLPVRPQDYERVAEDSNVKQRPRERGQSATKPGIPIK